MSMHLEKVKEVNYTAAYDYIQWIFWVAFCKRKITQQMIRHPYSAGSDERISVAKDSFHWCRGPWYAKRNIELDTTQSTQYMLLNASRWW